MSRYLPSLSTGFALIAALGGGSFPPLLHSGEPADRHLSLRVRFWSDEVELTGAMPDERSADRLRMAVFNAESNKAVCDRLVVDPGRSLINLPRIDDLAGLIQELALSTIDSSLALDSKQLIVTGLTDSQVTHAAIAARLRMLENRLGGRTVSHRICIVTEDDLQWPQPVRPRPVLRPKPLTVSPFVLAEAAYGPPPPLIAKPLAIVPSTASTVPPGAQSSDPTEDANTAILESIQFAANTYLLRYEQFTQIDKLIEQIRSLPEATGKIVLRGYPDQPGSVDFNDWLGNARAEAVRRLFLDSGMPEEQFAIEVPRPTQKMPHLGSVLILVPRNPASGLATPVPPSPLDTAAESQPLRDPGSL